MIYLILAYCLLQIGLGVWLGQKVKSSGDFFVAGRTLSPGLLFATLLAANVGAGSTVGATGLGYRDGLAAWWWVGSAGVGCLILGQFVGPRIWKIASDHDLKTAGDFLEWRFGRDVRGVVASLLWVGTIAILAGQLTALAWILNVVAGLDKTTGTIIGGVVATIYFSAGGLKSSAYVNVVQLTVKIVGFVVAVPLILMKVGGVSALHAATAVPDSSWNFFSSGASGIQYLALLAPAFIISPGLLQKVYGARDASAVRWGVTINSLALFIFACFPPLLGLCARALHPGLANPELALPTLFVSDLHPALGALGLAAVVSAELSTADAVLFILATSLSKDLYKTFINKNADDGQVLKVARFAALGGGILGIYVAIQAASVIGVLSIFYSMLSVCLFVPVILGLYVKSADRTHALTAIFTGIASFLLAHFTSGGKGYYGFTPPLIGLLISAVAAMIALAVRPAAQPKELTR
jgi:SSS family solute:Na+ symporter